MLFFRVEIIERLPCVKGAVKKVNEVNIILTEGLSDNTEVSAIKTTLPVCKWLCLADHPPLHRAGLWRLVLNKTNMPRTGGFYLEQAIERLLLEGKVLLREQCEHCKSGWGGIEETYRQNTLSVCSADSSFHISYTKPPNPFRNCCGKFRDLQKWKKSKLCKEIYLTPAVFSLIIVNVGCKAKNFT